MNQEDYDAVSQGIVFGATLMFFFMLSVMYALQLTPSEQVDQCQSIMRLDNEHTDQISQ